MKKKLMLVMLVLVLIVSAVACSKSNQAANIEGKWRLADSADFGMPNTVNVMMIFEDGKVGLDLEATKDISDEDKEILENVKPIISKEEYKGSYKVVDDKVIEFVMPGPEAKDGNVDKVNYKLEGDKLTLTDSDMEIELIKVK